MSRARASRRALTLGEHFFWTVLASFATCVAVAVLLFLTSR